MSFERPLLLLVSDDSLLARSVSLAASTHAAVLVARSMEMARAELAHETNVRAIVVDGALLECEVARELSELRRLAPLASCLFVAPQFPASLVNALQVERVQLLVRPLPASALANFVERSVRAGRLSTASLEQWSRRFAIEQRLSRVEVELLPLVLGLTSVDALCDGRGLERSDVVRGLRRLVKKCKARTIDRLARNLMRDAYLASSELTAELIEPASASCF